MLVLAVQDTGGQAHRLDVVIDTGFSGYLTLPVALIARLGLPWLYQAQSFLADGSVQTFNVHEATIIWDGQPRTVEAEAVDAGPLIGMALLAGHAVLLEVKDGGAVTVQELP